MYEYEETAEESRQETESRESMRLFIRQAAQSTEGRKFFRSLLDVSECLHQAPETGGALFLVRHEGRRDVGIWLLGQLAEADALANVLKMEKK
ncbi:MAG: hypothetical protein PUB69_00365 [Desulfovibrionaceae bacterium]|nr:hypothetical protein [Desulfovibrionaceae bacterium]